MSRFALTGACGDGAVTVVEVALSGRLVVPVWCRC
jgi:hypothetical protein